MLINKIHLMFCLIFITFLLNDELNGNKTTIPNNVNCYCYSILLIISVVSDTDFR